MTPEQYQLRVYGVLDAMGRTEKDSIITGLLSHLYPHGHSNHVPGAIAFLEEAKRLLAPFHPTQLRGPEEQTQEEDGSTPEF